MRARPQRTLELFYPAMREFPGGFATMAIALDEYLAQPKTLVLRGRGAMRSSAWQARARARVPAGYGGARHPR